ncbi:esterase [Talaromyces atroroseus]|uniref:Esterase n=1 Tax=Talaromyces atroroseus TaxID=1441469 RepID=A0A1Q5Q6M1_TALAT|nr:esterase [Talaromyces atroroseus]OKL55495.1 esterase [Talaromyces atroroseus]
MVIEQTDAKIDQNLHLPRILCLHGGGTNAKIFRAQCRIIKRYLSTTFRLVFAEAPFSSQAGPDVTSVYKEFGPFKRWLRSNETHPEIHPDDAVQAIDDSLKAAMSEDDRRGGRGEWVGLIGFSQGAKICASLMFRQQVRAERLGLHHAGSNWRFAVILAGRGPLVSLDHNLLMTPALVDASQISMTALPDENFVGSTEHVLYLPTIHVHGTLDAGLDEHRKLLRQYSERGTTRVMEWEGNHRIPIKTKDVMVLVQNIFDVAYETDVLTKQVNSETVFPVQKLQSHVNVA